jgi:hypothetical protein
MTIEQLLALESKPSAKHAQFQAVAGLKKKQGKNNSNKFYVFQEDD